MLATLKYVLITAIRDRLFIGLFALIALTTGIASFLEDATLTEQYEMSVVYAAASTRLVLVLGLLVFVAFHVQRLYETREIEAILSKPISRSAFVISYWLGLALVAIALAIPVIASVIYFVGEINSGVCLWAASIIMESLIVVCIGLFCSLTIEKATTSVLTGIGIYMMARLASFFVAIFQSRPELLENEAARSISGIVMKSISAILPRLDLFGQTNWLLYGIDNVSWSLFFIQTAIFIPLLLLAAIFDIKRKCF
ncbi:MAG: hypothetical protein GY804_08190 [Alphaproteobacteria bacterium]|nr:hypothetical protein [Alphaproteobacteria bacterium]